MVGSKSAVAAAVAAALMLEQIPADCRA